MTQIPATTLALALRESGYASGLVPARPASLAPFLDLAEVPLPALKPGQVLIAVALSPVNPSDLFFIQGGYGQARVAGQAAGFEGMGRVIATNGAEGLLGRRVSFLATGTGAWARHAVTDAAFCLPLRDDVPDADGAALIVNPVTAVALIERAGSGACVITAAGSELGRLMLSLARDRGLAAIAVVRRAEAAAELTALGAAEVLVSSDPGYADALRAAVKVHRPQVLLDAVADQGSADLFFALPAGASWVVYGRMSGQAPALTQMAQFIFLDKRIEGFWLSRWLPAAPPERREAVVAEVQARFADGRWRTRTAARLGLDRALDGILPALAQGGGKVMIAP